MPDQPSQTPLSAADALTDAEAMAWLDDLLARGLACAVGATLALILAVVPLPFSPSTSATQIILEIVVAPMEGHFQYVKPPDLFFTYVYVSCVLAVIWTHPVLLYHLLDLTSPKGVPNRARRMAAVILAMLASFTVGTVTGLMFVVPLFVGFLINWNPIDIVVMWQPSEYIETVTSFTFGTGFAFEIPALVAGMVWLRIASRERLAQWRPYAVLAAFIVAAWVTPTPDPLNQAIIAIPICLLYELGLLLARLVPHESIQPTV